MCTLKEGSIYLTHCISLIHISSSPSSDVTRCEGNLNSNDWISGVSNSVSNVLFSLPFPPPCPFHSHFLLPLSLQSSSLFLSLVRRNQVRGKSKLKRLDLRGFKLSKYCNMLILPCSLPFSDFLVFVIQWNLDNWTTFGTGKTWSD